MHELQPITSRPDQPSYRRRNGLPMPATLVFLLLLLLLEPSPRVVRAQECAGDCSGDGVVTVDELIQGINVSLGLEVQHPCTAFDTNEDGEVTIDELIVAVNNALVGCPVDHLAFVTASDFQTGSFATIGLASPRQVEPTSPARRINGDAGVRTHGGLVYVINRFLADNIQVLDPADDFATIWQCSTGVGTNPHDIAFASRSKAYVTTYDTTALLVIDPSVASGCSGFLLDSIDLTAFADADGIPEMDQMALVDGILYVSVQRLDRNDFFSPAGPGALVVIDTANDQVIGEVPLSGENPFVATKGLPVWDGALLVGEAGSFGVADGGIERVDLATRTAEGFFVTEEQLGGDLNDFVLVADDLGYAVVGRSDFTNDLVAFDPSSGSVTARLLDGVEYLPDIELNDRGELFVADRTPGNSGIRIFRARDGVELTADPLHLGLPPFEIGFL